MSPSDCCLACYRTSSLVFRRKDHCEARVNFEVSSYLANGSPPQIGPTQLIDPKFTEPYYTEEALPHLSTPSVQNPTTPNKYNLYRNTDISSADRSPPPPIKHRSLENHYSKEVSHIEESTYTHGRLTPPPPLTNHRSMQHHYTK